MAKRLATSIRGTARTSVGTKSVSHRRKNQENPDPATWEETRGHERKRGIVDKKPPINSDPESPRYILAFGLLKNKKASTEPINAARSKLVA
jgi:hypothetical protein